MEAPAIDGIEDPIANKKKYYTFVDAIIEAIENRTRRKEEESEVTKTETIQSLAHELYILLSSNLMTETELEEEISRLQSEKVLVGRTDTNMLRTFIRAKFKQQERVSGATNKYPDLTVVPKN